MLWYKMLAISFSYPDETFFSFFPHLEKRKKSLYSEYDRLFRTEEISLYGVEYQARNEFQKARLLADLMGFYRAFGVKPRTDRPDLLSVELEFMHYLLFKIIHVQKQGKERKNKTRERICRDAQKKFFWEYLQPAAKKIAKAIRAKTENGFYREISEAMLDIIGMEENALENET